MKNVLFYVLLTSVILFMLRRGITGLFVRQGYSYQDRGRYSAAERCFRRALRLEEALQAITGQGVGVALVCSSLGFLYHRQRRIHEAIAAFMRAIDIYSRSSGRQDEAAPVYASLGKVYFDIGDNARAEEASRKALEIYRQQSHAGEAIRTINQLLDAIAGRKENVDTARTYRNTEYQFLFTIPPEWQTQTRVDQFSDTGGLVAISHRTRNATFNVSVGRLDREDWRTMEARAVAVKEFLVAAHAGSRGIEMRTAPVAGEQNTVSAECVARSQLLGRLTDSTYGLISILHNGLEYTIQWAATHGFEEQARAIVRSFKFED